MAKSYLITGIDADTWKDFKAACVHYDISIKATLIKHIQNIANDYRIYKRQFTGKKIYKHREVKK